MLLLWEFIGEIQVFTITNSSPAMASQATPPAVKTSPSGRMIDC